MLQVYPVKINKEPQACLFSFGYNLICPGIMDQALTRETKTILCVSLIKKYVGCLSLYLVVEWQSTDSIYDNDATAIAACQLILTVAHNTEWSLNKSDRGEQ